MKKIKAKKEKTVKVVERASAEEVAEGKKAMAVFAGIIAVVFLAMLAYALF